MLRKLGAPASELEELRNASMPARPFVDFVAPDVLMEDGDKPDMPGWDLTALWTPGHSPGHLCFWEATNRLMLTGDCVLPRITPNVNLNPQTEPDPLGDYLRSLERLAEFDADEALPAHEWRYVGHRGPPARDPRPPRAPVRRGDRRGARRPRHRVGGRAPHGLVATVGPDRRLHAPVRDRRGRTRTCARSSCGASSRSPTASRRAGSSSRTRALLRADEEIRGTARLCRPRGPSGRPEHALADDVALDLAGAAGDAEHRREQERRRLVAAVGTRRRSHARPPAPAIAMPRLGAALAERRWPRAWPPTPSGPGARPATSAARIRMPSSARMRSRHVEVGQLLAHDRVVGAPAGASEAEARCRTPSLLSDCALPPAPIATRSLASMATRHPPAVVDRRRPARRPGAARRRGTPR